MLQGCVHPLEARIRSRLLILGALGLSCALFQILGFLYSLCLYCKLGVLKKYLADEKKRKQEEQQQNSLKFKSRHQQRSSHQTLSPAGKQHPGAVNYYHRGSLGDFHPVLSNGHSHSNEVVI